MVGPYRWSRGSFRVVRARYRSDVLDESRGASVPVVEGGVGLNSRLPVRLRLQQRMPHRLNSRVRHKM